MVVPQSRATAPEPIAIVGSACRFPGNANNPSKLWQLLSDPTDLCSPMPDSRLRASGFYHPDNSYHGHTNVKKLSSYFLSEKDVERRFDARFFNIKPAEANVMDPQVRLLLETTYEALEAGGHAMENLQGSDTSCFVGLMLGDYEQMMLRDEDNIGDYHVTGVARSLVSNRLSYFFDWHGQSMTIDTACSSSLVAVHQAVQVLRTGSSRVAIAAGANMLLDTAYYIAESKLQMLSPDGQSRMWDDSANGYGRGEGIAAIVLKRLSDAEADGDHIECVIRETGLNQDGRTKGITMPNADAQRLLIQDCYKRAGLDLRIPGDRPQYFEAHGTGTPAGDPVEAEAISKTFFKGDMKDAGLPPLFVGSVKTVIGHSEGAAGLAAIMKTSLSLQNSLIPPNLHFNSLNPKIRPFYSNLRVPIKACPWVSVEGQPRRASVNSFGFGGSNAHVILESYFAKPKQLQTALPQVTALVTCAPFVFSAASLQSLLEQLSRFSEWINESGDLNISLRDLAYTLYSRRSYLPFSVSISATSRHQLCQRIKGVIESAKADMANTTIVRGNRSLVTRKPKILGIFTGQGAQWARMGAELIENYEVARGILTNLDTRLSRLPEPDRPSWSLIEELLKDSQSSRVNEARYSHPLCAAVQILLVNILHAAEIEFSAIVGHSSGEIGAAYAAGRLTAEDAICIAYYRGLHSGHMETTRTQPGGMLAVETTHDDVLDLCSLPEFEGKVVIAAYNSASNFTLAGDLDAIERIKIIFDDENKMARILRVDKAYHSHHMTAPATAYLNSLNKLDTQIKPSGTCRWFSSVYEDDAAIEAGVDLKGDYWTQNMVKPVLFMQAVQRAHKYMGPFDLALEVGPHPALKSVLLQNLGDVSPEKNTASYTSLLRRKSGDIESIADGLGYIWSNLGREGVNLRAYDLFLSNRNSPQLVMGLPSYCWDHDKNYWHESRFSKAIRARGKRVHELLGHTTPDSSKEETRWRNILRIKEIPWLVGHQLQNQVVFPAAGYAVLALEACMELFGNSKPGMVEILNLSIDQALTFDEDASVEAIFSLSDISENGQENVTASFRYYVSLGTHQDQQLQRMAHGQVTVWFTDYSKSGLMVHQRQQLSSLIKVEPDDFYASLKDLEYQYSGSFRALTDLERAPGVCKGFIQNEAQPSLLVHPSLLDTAFQAVLLAHSAPYDGKLWTIHVPKTIRRIAFSPDLCSRALSNSQRVPFESVQPMKGSSALIGDVDVFDVKSNETMIQVEGLSCVPLSPATANDDKNIFSTIVWDVDKPDTRTLALPSVFNSKSRNRKISHVLERVAYFYLRKLEEKVPHGHLSRTEGKLKGLFTFVAHITARIKAGQVSFWQEEWNRDSLETILKAYSPYAHLVDFQLLNAIGSNLPAIVTGEVSGIEIGMKDNRLATYYSDAIGMKGFPELVAKIVKQIAHRYPRMDILEIGAGTGAATASLLEEVGDSSSTYTFTDISSGFFEQAQEKFGSRVPGMTYKILDISKDPGVQGFADSSYDLVIALLVLHATPRLQETLSNVRRILRPGGWLVVVELTSNDIIRAGAIFGAFPDWWSGADDGRVFGPAASIDEWDQLLRKTGFSGCDISIPTTRDDGNDTSVAWVSQAIDDRIGYLRTPVLRTAEIEKLGIDMEEIVISGGQTSLTKQITTELVSLLKPHYRTIRSVDNLADLLHGEIAPSTTILSLTDIDKPLFQDLDPAAFEAMKTITLRTSCILWVTAGRRAKSPFSNMSTGFVRSVLEEAPLLTFQFLDFEDLIPNATAILQALLRLKAGIKFQQANPTNILTSVEPELVLREDGKILIPRLVYAQDMNDRYNSAYREITHSANLGRQTVRLDSGPDNMLFTREHILAEPPHSGSLAVTHSLIPGIKMGDRGKLYLSHCQNCDNCGDGAGKFIVSAECGSNVRELVGVPIPRRPEIESKVGLLLLTFMKLTNFDEHLGLYPKSELLVYEAEPHLAALLEIQAKRKGFQVLFMSEHPPVTQNHWIKFSRHAPDRVLRNAIPQSVSAFLDCSLPGDSHSATTRILSNLPPNVKVVTIDELLGFQSPISSETLLDGIVNKLKIALNEAIDDLHGNETQLYDYRAIQAVDIHATKTNAGRLAVVEWKPDSNVTLRRQPIDSQQLFSPYKTYWLAGLSGALGVSLAEWMINCGAKYIVITSRNPKVDASWMQEMANRNVTVKVFANDLTNREQLLALFNSFGTSLPPIAGIAQGAMVLEDTSLENMTSEDVLKVTRPKVEGSKNLHDVVGDTPLDFFVFFSSVGSVVGNSGQANYSAANWFMAALAEQRRQRGLAASIIHIGPILGAGYLAEAKAHVRRRFTRTAGHRFLSDRDLHHQFAEAVVAGVPTAGGLIENVTGLVKIGLSGERPPPWITNPFMSHFILPETDAKTIDETKESKEPLKVQLEQARSSDEITKLIKDAFLPKLCALFRLDPADIMNTDVNVLFMDEIGIDSLIAVEIRSWWMKTLNVNIPVLKILSGISVGELITFGMGTLDLSAVEDSQVQDAGLPTENDGAFLDKGTTPPSTLESGSPETVSPPFEGTPLTEPGDLTMYTLNSRTGANTPDSTEKKFSYPQPVGESLPLSFGQSMFWAASAFQGDPACLNHTGLFRLSGALRVGDLEHAVLTLGQRHDTLRTCFLVENGQARKHVIGESRLSLEHRYIRNVKEASTLAKEIQDHTFDWAQGETMRVVLLSLSPADNFLLLATHSLVMDGFSGVQFIKELLRLYNHEAIGGDVLQFSDYGEEQMKIYKAGGFSSELHFWRRIYQDFPAPLPILRVSRSVSRPTALSFENNRIDIRIDTSTKASVNAVCRRYKVTPFHFYLAVLRALLCRYTDEEDIAIGVGDSNRVDEKSLESLGPYVNLLPLRFHTAASHNFGQMLRETRSIMYSSLANSRVPFQVLLDDLDVPRHANCTPIFQSFIDYRMGVQEKQKFGDIELEMCSFQASKSPYDLALDIIDNTDSDCLIMFVARKDMYTDEELKLLSDSYTNLVRDFAAEPDIPLSGPLMYQREDVAQAMSFSNGPRRARQWPRTLTARVDEIAKKHPNKPAAKLRDGELMTYAQLTTRSYALAAALMRSGVKIGSRVAVLLEPNFDLIVSILAIWRVGAVYVPLDLSISQKRLEIIIGDCNASIIVANDDTEGVARMLCTKSIVVVNMSTMSVETPVAMSTVNTEDAAIILYTSGSSGVPKGILLNHEGLRNWMEQVAEMCDLTEDEVVLQQSSIGFDMSVTQIFTALCLGGTIQLVPQDIRGDAQMIIQLIISGGVTLTSATPSEYVSWLTYGRDGRLRQSSWRRALSAGEPIEPGPLDLFISTGKDDLRMFNSYGPTEITLVASATELPLQSGLSRDDITAGYPLPNYSIYVLDDNLRPVPVGVQGEIFVGGAGVSSGYIGNPKLTGEKFVIDPFATPDQKRQGWTVMHRTGDLGRWTAQGALVIESRISGDTQIKLRGQRIDLREVEIALIASSKGVICEAVVSVRRETAQNLDVLIAHITFNPGRSEQTDGRLLAMLPSMLPLPRYMWPGAIIPIDHLPRSASGKLDRKTIASLELPQAQGPSQHVVLALTDTEERLLEQWRAVIPERIIQLHQVGPTTDFFHVGGTSILLLDLQARTQSHFGIKLPVVQMFESSTLRGMAQRLLKQDMLVKIVDWEQETALGPKSMELQHRSLPFEHKAPRVVVVTGATGFLGQGIIHGLLQDQGVEKIHCIAVRNAASRDQFANLSKVELHEGDLTLRRLGLPEEKAEAIFSSADCVIHNGADVSHLKTFQSLRAANLQATKELVEMIAPRRIPIHYVSTGGTCTYSGLTEFKEVSASRFPPPPDAFDGYTASKWASERYLEKVHEYCGWPICIHRPSSVIRKDLAKLDLMQSLIHYSKLTRSVPLIPNLRGVLELVSLDTVVSRLLRELHLGPREGQLRFAHEGGSVRIEMRNLKAYIDEESRGDVQELHPREWAQRAGARGLHDLLVAFFDSLEDMRPVTYPRLVQGIDL